MTPVEGLLDAFRGRPPSNRASPRRRLSILLCWKSAELMLKTIDRYVIREVVPPFILALLIFTFILEIPPVMEQLEQLLAKGVPWPTVGRIILLLSPQALGLTIPMALLVGLLIGLGRMSTDREAVALLACGVSPYRLLRPVLLLAARRQRGHLYVMIAAIPDANQTLPPDPLRHLSQAGRERRPPARVLRELPELGAVHPGQPAPGEPAGRTCWSPTPRKPDARRALHGRARPARASIRDKRTVDLVLRTAPATRHGHRARSRPTGSRTDSIVTLDPEDGVPAGRSAARRHREDHRRSCRKGIADKVRRNGIAAPGNHGDPAEVLVSGRLPRLRGHRAWRSA